MRLLGWIAAGWAATALTATVVLGVSGAVPGRWPEEAHVLGHLGLCGALALLLAESAGRAGCGSTADRLSPSGPHPNPLPEGEGVSASPARAAGLALAATVLFGAAIEAIQLRHEPHWTEVAYDLLTDGLGATLGLAAWAHLDRARREPVGHLLSAVLHPLWIAPLGLAMILYAAERSGGTAARWTAAAAACLVPAIALWAFGIARRWWSDADLSRRADRTGLYAVGCASAAAFAILALRGPDPVLALGGLCAAGAVLGAAITVAGLKVSGHVAIPAALGLAMISWSARGPWLLLAVAVALSWARVAAGRHRRVEVAAGWALAAALCLGLAVARG
jgi:hypothetical protein